MISADPGLRQALFLVRRGVPWEVATNLSPAELLAYCVVCGELDGGRWSWRAMRWEDAKP